MRLVNKKVILVGLWYVKVGFVDGCVDVINIKFYVVIVWWVWRIKMKCFIDCWFVVDEIIFGWFFECVIELSDLVSYWGYKVLVIIGCDG